jgi:hypothetical protein
MKSKMCIDKLGKQVRMKREAEIKVASVKTGSSLPLASPALDLLGGEIS